MFHVKQSLLTPRAFQEISGVPAKTLDRLERYVDLLATWQRRINLVSATSLADVWRRHVLDSAQLHSLLPARAGVVLDMGSGAGFPGMVLAIMGGHQVHLVESDARKCVFLGEVNRITGAGAVIDSCRIEDMFPLAADVVTARALARVDRLLDYAEPFLERKAICLFLKGNKVEEELTESKKKWKMTITRIESASHSSGTILKLGDIRRRHGI